MSLFLFDKESISYLLQLETDSAMKVDGEAFDLMNGAVKLLKVRLLCRLQDFMHMDDTEALS